MMCTGEGEPLLERIDREFQARRWSEARRLAQAVAQDERVSDESRAIAAGLLAVATEREGVATAAVVWRLYSEAQEAADSVLDRGSPARRYLDLQFAVFLEGHDLQAAFVLASKWLPAALDQLEPLSRASWIANMASWAWELGRHDVAIGYCSLALSDHTAASCKTHPRLRLYKADSLLRLGRVGEAAEVARFIEPTSSGLGGRILAELRAAGAKVQ